MAAIENIPLFQASSGLGKSRFAKDFWQEGLTSLTARVSIHLYCSNGKRWKDMISLIQSIRHKMWQSLMTSMQHHLIPGVLNVFDKDNTSKDFLFLIYKKQGMGFGIMQSSQKHPRLEISMRVASLIIISWEGQKEVKKYKLVEDLIYGLN